VISRLRSAYAWLLLSVIVLSLFVVLPLVRLALAPFDPHKDRLRSLVAWWVSWYGRLSPLYRFHIVGRKHLPRQGPYVLVANHESGLDIVCLLQLASPARFLAEHWIFATPIAGWLLKVCDHIPVEVGNRESGAAALASAEAALAAGTPVAIFPEGHLHPDGLGRFRPGAFVLAKRSGLPLVPVRISGTGAAWRPGTVVVHGRHEIEVRVLPPIESREVRESEPEVLLERTRAAIEGAVAGEQVAG